MLLLLSASFPPSTLLQPIQILFLFCHSPSMWSTAYHVEPTVAWPPLTICGGSESSAALHFIFWDQHKVCCATRMCVVPSESPVLAMLQSYRIGLLLALKLLIHFYLLKFVSNHGKSLEDGISRACDGHNSLWTISLWDIDSCSTLQRTDHILSYTLLYIIENHTAMTENAI